MLDIKQFKNQVLNKFPVTQALEFAFQYTGKVFLFTLLSARKFKDL